MKNLSAANQSNIADRTKSPVIIVRIPSITDAEWSFDYDAQAGTLLSLSPIHQSMAPYGGLGHFDDFDFQVAAAETFIQDNVMDFLPVEVVVQYGTDAEIPICGGMVDNYGYDRGTLSVSCISQFSIRNKDILIAQANTTTYPDYIVPTETDGKWIPMTIGSPYRPDGLIIFRSTGTYSGIYVAYNAAVTGHTAIGEELDPAFYLWLDRARLWITEEGGDQTLTTWLADGIQYIIGDTAQAMTENRIIPLSGAWTGAIGTDEANAVDDDTATYALLDNPAGDGVTTGDRWRGRLPEIEFGREIIPEVMYFLGKIEKQYALNHAGRTLEKFHAGIEVIDGTDPVDPGEVIALISGAAVTFNNLDGSDAEDALIIPVDFSLTGNLKDATVIPRETSTQFTNIYLQINCVEEDPAGGGNEADYFRIHEASIKLFFGMVTHELRAVYGGIRGYDDDSGGTYTGTAYALIEIPSDVVYFMLGKLLGLSNINTASIAQARSDYGLYRLAHQIIDQQSTEQALGELAAEAKLILHEDTQGDWKTRAWVLPTGTPDKTFYQDMGHFTDVDGPEVTTDRSEADLLYNQFTISWAWNEAAQKFNEMLTLDENTAGDIGTWLTASQAMWNITRRRIIECRWINDADTAQSYGNYLIYRYADRKRVVNASHNFYALDLELGDRVVYDHDDLDAQVSGGDSAEYEIYDIMTDLMGEMIKTKSMQASVLYTSLYDPTQPILSWAVSSDGLTWTGTPDEAVELSDGSDAGDKLIFYDGVTPISPSTVVLTNPTTITATFASPNYIGKNNGAPKTSYHRSLAGTKIISVATSVEMQTYSNLAATNSSLMLYKALFSVGVNTALASYVADFNDSAAAWTEQSGTWIVNSVGFLQKSATNNTDEHATLQQDEPDIQGECDWKLSASGTHVFAFILRWQDANNFLRAELQSLGSGGAAYIFEVVAGVPATLTSDTSLIHGLSAGGTYAIKVRDEGDGTINLYIQGDLELTWTTSRFKGTTLGGVKLYRALSTEYIDNLIYTAI